VVFVTLFFIIKNPAAKTLDQFLSNINDSSKISLQNFVSAEILDDPFITSLMNQNIIKKHRIIKTQRTRQNNVRIKASLTTDLGSFDAWFSLSKLSNRWLVTGFPKVTNIEAAVP